MSTTTKRGVMLAAHPNNYTRLARLLACAPELRPDVEADAIRLGVMLRYKRQSAIIWFRNKQFLNF
jgi:hypothetical protein